MSETAEAQIKTVPANLEAEQAVLGSLLIDSRRHYQGLDHAARHRLLSRTPPVDLQRAPDPCMKRREPADFVTLVDELERNEQLDGVGGPAYVTELINSTPHGHLRRPLRAHRPSAPPLCGA